VTTFGHRVYFAMFNPHRTDDAAMCYDFVAGAVCPHYPYRYVEDRLGQSDHPLAVYGQAVDSTGECLWSYGDGARFSFGSTDDPSRPCLSSTTSATTLPVTPANSYCGTDLSGAMWGAVSLRGIDTSDYATATVTIKDSTGTVVSGFGTLPVPASQVVDISSIPKTGDTAAEPLDPGLFRAERLAIAGAWANARADTISSAKAAA
jgi:hypothetical protein